MKKLSYLITILFFHFCGFAQNKEYSIIVKDMETQLPIENVTVVIVKTKQILLSNRDGKVTFILNGGSNVQLSEASHKNLTLSWTSLTENKFVVYLDSKNNQLDEVILSKESPQKTLKKIVENSKKTIMMPYRLKVYVREFFMLDGKYSYYNDGLVHFQFDKNRINTTLLVEQNRSYGLIEADVSADLKGYNLNNVMENYCSFKYFQPILDSGGKNKYYFTIKRHKANDNYYVMSVIPMDKDPNAIDNYEIIYDNEKKIIMEFTIVSTSKDLSKVEYKRTVGSENITRSFVKVAYRLDGLNYYVLNSNEEIGYHLILKDKIKNIQVQNRFVTTNFNKQKFVHKDTDVFKEKTLFNKKNKILTNYWDVSGFTATDEEKNVINFLEYKF